MEQVGTRINGKGGYAARLGGDEFARRVPGSRTVHG
jgi:GGDEF domain-containing protein